MARNTDAEHRVGELAAFIASLHRALEHLDALPDRLGRCDSACGFLAPDPDPDPGAGAVPVGLSPIREAADEQRWRNAPVACSLTPDSLGERGRQWRELLDGADRQEIPDGVRLTLPAERAGAVAALDASEQQCCPFFDFRLHFDGPVLHLRVRAPAAAADLVAELFTPVG